MEPFLNPSLRCAIKLKNPRPSLTEPEIAEIRTVFDLFAGEGTDMLNTSELKETMKSLGFEKNNPTIYKMISDLDEAQGGDNMTFEEFLEKLTAPVGNTETKEGVNKLFDLFVEDGGDTITLDHIQNAVNELGEELTTKEVQEILRSAASNGDTITREDFYNIVTKKSFS